MPARASYYKLNRPATDALGTVGKHVGSIEPKLRALVELRVSQINGCVYCVDAHSMEARQHGETEQRIDCVCVWRESRFFDDAERAALEWAEAMTNIAQTRAPDDAYAALVPHYSEQQIVDLSLIIATMNAWNRMAIAHRTMPTKRSTQSK
jgi:AhpD family alkylhydroperoxidase